ncbi:hypothetical protein LCGC14_0579970 [marine sediment metagenome]|uniref:Uncharacterized protein n=1 Tax=marine sediment metagenome TaxID=412755 RepID=A0A0F9RGR5_9ZZZZ
MKTYSVAIKVKKGYWVTNFGKSFNLLDIDWNDVLDYCKSAGHIAFGYYYGHKSNELTSARCRTELAYII